jgi:malate dehydrogenase (oxaloacetate-decarboxylating)(NADP+)
MLARQDVPESVASIYPDENLQFGTGYIIPKPFDSRLFVEVSFAMAKAAIETGVARDNVNLEEYRRDLELRNKKRFE